MSLETHSASVEFRRVTKAYGPVVAVREVSFTVAAGTLVTLLGPSGCGKTTTLRLIAGLEMTTSGQILIGGSDVTRVPATDRDVSMVFQSYALFPHMTVLENVCYGLRVGGEPRDRAVAAAREGLALLGLVGFDDRLPASSLAGSSSGWLWRAHWCSSRGSSSSTSRSRISTPSSAVACARRSAISSRSSA